MADRGAGSRRRGATVVRQQADGGVRLPPAPLPLETEAGQPGHGRRWLRHRGGTAREGRGGWRWAGQREPVRRVAAPLDPTATRCTRSRAPRTAPKAGRTLPPPTRAGAGWLRRRTTLAPGTWSTAEVLEISRARWPGALGLQKMPQGLRLQQMRRPHLARVAATVRALRGAWALHEDTTPQLRTRCRATAPPQTLVGRRGVLSGLGLDPWRQQGQGRGSATRRQARLPRFRRFGGTRPRPRGHQDSTVRVWLEQRAHTYPGRRPLVA